MIKKDDDCRLQPYQISIRIFPRLSSDSANNYYHRYLNLAIGIEIALLVRKSNRGLFQKYMLKTNHPLS